MSTSRKSPISQHQLSTWEFPRPTTSDRQPFGLKTQIYDTNEFAPTKLEWLRLWLHSSVAAADPELAQIVAVWRNLPSELKSAILTIVRSSSPNEGGRTND